MISEVFNMKIAKRILILLTTAFCIWFFLKFREVKEYSYDNYFENIEYSERQVGQNQFKGSINFTALVLKPSGWNEEAVLDQLVKASKILSQCQIEIGKIKIVTAQPKNLVVDFDMISTKDLINNLPESIRPIIVFFRYTLDPTTTAWAYWTSDFIRDKESNMIFISDEVITKDYKLLRDETYNTTAHELSHMLGNLKHTVEGEKNLMAGVRRDLNSFLTNEQCKRIRSNKLINYN